MGNLVASVEPIGRKVKSTPGINSIAYSVCKFSVGNAKKGPFGIRVSGCLWDIIHCNLVEDLKNILRLPLWTLIMNISLRS